MKSFCIINRRVEMGLRLTGIWPGTAYKNVIRFGWILMMSTAQVSQYRYLLEHLNDLANLVDGLSTTLPYSLLFLKLIIFWINRRLFKSILIEMTQDWTNPWNNNHNIKKVMIKKCEISNRCSNLIMGIYTAAVLSYSTAVVKFAINTDTNTGTGTRDLLIKMSFPFASENSPVYEYVMVWQFFNLLAVALSIGFLDCLMITLVLHISGQINIIRTILAGITSGDEKYEFTKIAVKSVIIRHHKVIKFSGLVNQLFTYIALLQFLSNTFIICCIGYIMISSLGTDDGMMILVKSTFFYLAIISEAFIFCFSGEYLSGESNKLVEAAYRSLWYTLEPNEIRAILLLMLRSQRTLTITAGRFMELSLESFAGILKASASYISVLNAIS